MMCSDIPLAHTLVTLCKSFGIDQVVISPGSRNAPLTLGFTSDPFFECFSIVDERSAGFFALGLSQQSGKPTALVCTSGSALLNYHPAVAEAFYSRIPLVVISADRPPYKIDIGDGQTIRQEGVLEKHTGYQAALLQDVLHAKDAIRWPLGEAPSTSQDLETEQLRRQSRNEALIGQGLQIAVLQKLPIHLNAPFEEPLYGTLRTPVITPSAFPLAPAQDPSIDWEFLISQWDQAKKKLILIGSMPPGGLGKTILDQLAGDDSIMVMTETTSNVHHPDFFPSIDSIMAPLELSAQAAKRFSALRPDILLTMGGMVVSKKVKQFLRKYIPDSHWHVDPHQAPDTFYCLDLHIPLSPQEFLGKFLPKVTPSRYHYTPPWKLFRHQYEAKRGAYLRQIPFSDMTAFARIIEAIPPGIQVQLANSSTIRYTQLFDMAPGNPVFCNRGTSGIEGSTSTAIGAAVNSGDPTLLISGDLSFLYDSNAFWNKYVRPDFRIVVINNQGGGIFRILPGKEENKTFETYFETVQEGTLNNLCNHFGIQHWEADSEESLVDRLHSFFEPSQKPRLLEVRTPRKLNDRILLGYFDFLSSTLLQTTDKNEFNE